MSIGNSLSTFVTDILVSYLKYKLEMISLSVNKENIVFSWVPVFNLVTVGPCLLSMKGTINNHMVSIKLYHT